MVFVSPLALACLELASEHFRYAVFPYPQPGQHPPLVENNGCALAPDCGSYFFSHASLSLGHLHPTQNGVIDPTDPLRPQNLLRWPAASPVTRSTTSHLPLQGDLRQPPVFLPPAAIPFFHYGLDRLCHLDALQDPNLNHAAALTGTDLNPEQMTLLQHSSLPQQFPDRVLSPLQGGDLDKAKSTWPSFSWHVKKGRLRSVGSLTPPDDASIQELPRSTRDPLPNWVDKLYLKIAHLAALLAEVQDLPKSDRGWIKCSALSTYNGPSVPGNFDTHSGQVVNTNTFVLTCSGLTQSLTDEYIKGLVAKDNMRGRNRFQLGLFAQGKTSIACSLCEQSEPYAAFFFQSSMLRVLTREGICPNKKSPQGKSSLLKVQPTEHLGPVGASQLRGYTDACLLIDMHASIRAGTKWITHANDGCYGTNEVPLTPPFLVAAFRFTPGGAEEFWNASTAVRTTPSPVAPPAFFPHSDTVEAAQQDTRADMRLQANLYAPPIAPIPEEDDDMHDAPPDIEVSFSQEIENAFTHLEHAIDNMHTAQPTHPAFDPQFYLALSNLPLTYPWPILTIDLKNFLPLMDRHVLTHMVAARAAVNPAPVLGAFFTDLAHTIVHHILAPLNSQYMRPNLPQRIFSTEFWHAHLNYAALRADPTACAIGSMDGLAGDQLCQWNSVAPDSIIPATHLTLFLPPPLGDFVLANHQSHEEFRSSPATAAQSSPTFSVQQHLQFPLPQVFQNQAELLMLARQSAADGYLSAEAIPFLGHANQGITFKKVRWALRFPLPPPSNDAASRRFSSTPAFRQGPRSGDTFWPPPSQCPPGSS